ncbi:MAG: class I SAM-dependent methyltransferase [Deltaproteobacteria bacterium]|nr:class I SAM-dependent methyltransferase [Deltaproteobacteria bacterium]
MNQDHPEGPARRAAPFLLLISLAACGASPASIAETQTATAPSGDTSSPFDVATGDVTAALAGDHRTEAERARDVHRHPAETLAFFGFDPAMTVVEIWPGGGWYTKVLAPALRDHGTLIAATLDPTDSSFRGRFGREFRSVLEEHPELYDQVQARVLFPTNFMAEVEDGSVDLVLSFRSVHNWIRWEGHTPQPYFAAIARVLRPGGTFGIVQHRAPDGLEHGDDGTIGYVTEQLVIRLAEEAGLRLDERSQLNANPADPHDHAEGVWSLPPVLRGGPDAALVAIGESDRMTLRFVKPQ